MRALGGGRAEMSFFYGEREKSLTSLRIPIKSRFNGNYYRDYWIIGAWLFAKRSKAMEYGGWKIKIAWAGIEIVPIFQFRDERELARPFTGG